MLLELQFDKAEIDTDAASDVVHDIEANGGTVDIHHDGASLGAKLNLKGFAISDNGFTWRFIRALLTSPGP